MNPVLQTFCFYSDSAVELVVSSRPFLVPPVLLGAELSDESLDFRWKVVQSRARATSFVR